VQFDENPLSHQSANWLQYEHPPGMVSGQAMSDRCSLKSNGVTATKLRA